MCIENHFKIYIIKFIYYVNVMTIKEKKVFMYDYNIIMLKFICYSSYNKARRIK